MGETLIKIVMVGMLLLGPVREAAAVLAAVSGKPAGGDPHRLTEVLPGGDPASVAVSLAHGFPIWYRDANGVKLELCLDKPVGNLTPCLTAEPLAGSPVSFPNNFGTEAFWWNAVAFSTFGSIRDGSPTPGGDLLLVLALEASFAGGFPDDGQQVAFGRIRVRMNLPVAGTYRVTHPFGTRDYTVAAVGAGREVNQTQDLGIATPLDFLTVLSNGPDPALMPTPAGFPATDAGIVGSLPTTIGPFLTPAASPFVPATGIGGPFAVGGDRYLALPGPEITPVVQAVTGAPSVNALRIELLDPPPGFHLNGADGSQVITLDRFQVMGKVFNDGRNVPPVAVADVAATGRNRPVTIDVLANDSDPVAIDPSDPFSAANPANANVHGIDPQAIGLISGGNILRTASLTTANGGQVSRFTNLATGRSAFTYTPATGFTGVDSFEYVVQDSGGLLSQPATVTVTVEALSVTRAEYRPRFGRWLIAGTSTDTSANAVAIHGGPRALLSGSGVRGGAGLRVADSAIEFLVRLDQPTPSAVTAVTIHAGDPGSGGPEIFSLYSSLFDAPFTGTLSGVLTPANLQPRPSAGVNTFADAVAMIQQGGAHVAVRTAGNLPQVRGALVRPLIGTATVGTDGKWSYRGKPRWLPGPLGNVSATSTNGVTTGGVSLSVR